jgi:hypothetical protein
MWHSDEFSLVSAGLVPDLIPAVPYFAVFVLFSGRRCCKVVSSVFIAVNPCNYFLWGYLKDRVLQKSLHAIPEPKTSIQSEIEAISTETQKL